MVVGTLVDCTEQNVRQFLAFHKLTTTVAFVLRYLRIIPESLLIRSSFNQDK